MLFLLQLGLFSVVPVFHDNGINGADIADCANSDVFAGLIASLPALQAKRCFRALTGYVNKHTAAAAGRSGVDDNSVVAPRIFLVQCQSYTHASN